MIDSIKPNEMAKTWKFEYDSKKNYLFVNGSKIRDVPRDDLALAKDYFIEQANKAASEASQMPVSFERTTLENYSRNYKEAAANIATEISKRIDGTVPEPITPAAAAATAAAKEGATVAQAAAAQAMANKAIAKANTASAQAAAAQEAALAAAAAAAGAGAGASTAAEAEATAAAAAAATDAAAAARSEAAVAAAIAAAQAGAALAAGTASATAKAAAVADAKKQSSETNLWANTVAGINKAVAVVDSVINNPKAALNNIIDAINGSNDTGRFEGALGFGASAAQTAVSVSDSGGYTLDQELELQIPEKRFLSLDEQKQLAAYALYSVPKFYIPPMLIANQAGITAQFDASNSSGIGPNVRCFTFLSVGDLKIDDTTYPRNVPILKVPDADIDAVQDLGFGSGTIKASGRLWGEAGYARLHTLRELCKTRRPLIWTAQETGAWLVFPQNVPGVNTVANQPGQYFFEVTLICVGKISDKDPTVTAINKTRATLVENKFKKELALLTAMKRFKEFSAKSSGYFWDPYTQSVEAASDTNNGEISPSGKTTGAGSSVPTVEVGRIETPEVGYIAVPDVIGRVAVPSSVIAKNNTAARASTDTSKAATDAARDPQTVPNNDNPGVVPPQNPPGGSSSTNPPSGVYDWWKTPTFSSSDNVDGTPSLPPPVINEPQLQSTASQRPSTTNPIQGTSNAVNAGQRTSPGDVPLPSFQFTNNTATNRATINGKPIQEIPSQELLAHKNRYDAQAERYTELADQAQDSPRLGLADTYRKSALAYKAMGDRIGNELFSRGDAVLSQPSTEYSLSNTSPTGSGLDYIVGQVLARLVPINDGLDVVSKDGSIQALNGQLFEQITLKKLEDYKTFAKSYYALAVEDYSNSNKIGDVGGKVIAQEQMDKYQGIVNAINFEQAKRNLGGFAKGAPDSIISGQIRQAIEVNDLVVANSQAADRYGVGGDQPSNIGAGFGVGGFSGAGAMSVITRTGGINAPLVSSSNPDNYQNEFSNSRKIGRSKVLK